MNKAELIDLVAERAEISRVSATRVLNTILEVISAAVASGQTVTLVDFGSFRVGHRSRRRGINPRTNEVITIDAARVPKFVAGKALRRAVSEADSL